MEARSLAKEAIQANEWVLYRKKCVVRVEGYNHTDSTEYWKLVADGSLTGNESFELVSPILHGEEGLKDLEKVCWVLELCNVKVNESCGLHIHMDAADFTINTWKNLAEIEAELGK